MNRSTSASNRVVSIPLLFALVGLCTLSAYLLVPREIELYKRLIEDGNAERLRDVAEPGKVLVDAFGAVCAEGSAPDRIARVESILRQIPDIAGAYEALVGHLHRTEVETRERLMMVLVERAVAASDLDLARRICADLPAQVPSPSTETIEKLVCVYRFSNRSREALDLIAKLAGPFPPATYELLVDLNLEAGRPGEAFDLLRKAFDLAADPARRREVMARMTHVASQADRTNELDPYYREYLQHVPEETHDFQTYARNLAQHSEWQGRPNEAFELYRRLAVNGDREALDRCLALYSGLGRNNDMLATLLAVPESILRDDLLLLAELLANAGRNEAAIARYRSYLLSHPHSRQALVELGALIEEGEDLAGAYELYEKAAEQEPADDDLRERLARMLVALRRFDDLLALYGRMSRSEHTPATLESYALLAESMGRYEDLVNARAMILDRSNPRPDNYMDYARARRLAGQGDAVAVLRQGVERLPNSWGLRIALAETLYEDGQPMEAAEALATSTLTESPRAVALFIEVCNGCDAFQFALDHLGAGIEERIALPTRARLELAQIYEATDRTESAAKLFASVPDSSETWQILAAAEFRRGDMSKAEFYQRRYLENTSEADVEGWVFLGDIYKTTGREDQAQRCYRMSLALLSSR